MNKLYVFRYIQTLCTTVLNMYNIIIDDMYILHVNYIKVNTQTFWLYDIDIK